jgi:hypothetical protein
MVINNRIKFGYGTVAVGSDIWCGYFKVQTIHPPREPGTLITEEYKVEYLGKPVLIPIDTVAYEELYANFERVRSREISEFTYAGYVFDFNEYNEESVKVCVEHLKRAFYSYSICLAC